MNRGVSFVRVGPKNTNSPQFSSNHPPPRQTLRAPTSRRLRGVRARNEPRHATDQSEGLERLRTSLETKKETRHVGGFLVSSLAACLDCCRHGLMQVGFRDASAVGLYLDFAALGEHIRNAPEARLHRVIFPRAPKAFAHKLLNRYATVNT